MIIALRGGHNPNCKGVVTKYLDEQIEVWGLANRLSELLETYGHKVIRCESHSKNVKEDVLEGCKKANVNKADVFISLHSNSGGGVGSESFVAVNANKFIKDIGYRFCYHMEQEGFVNRGVKEKNYWEMTYTDMPNIILELFFTDSEIDVNRWRSISWEKKVRMIANAIIPEIPLYEDVENKQTLYRVYDNQNHVGTFKMISNVTNVVNEKLEKGTDTIRIEKVR